MSDDEHDHSDHDHVHGGFFAELPLSDLLSSAVHAHDREHMSHEYTEVMVSNFLDNLSVQQLLALRAILNSDKESTMNCFFDGAVVTILRCVHHVDPRTGDPIGPDGLEPLKANT